MYSTCELYIYKVHNVQYMYYIYCTLNPLHLQLEYTAKVGKLINKPGVFTRSTAKDSTTDEES